jgi:hypothetical protein
MEESVVHSEDRWSRVQTAIEPWQRAVLEHGLYNSLHDRRALHIFMEHHVWAVWDFMSVLTRLQRDLTCVDVPWVPRAVDPAAQRFVNEIKLGEESDEHPDGGWTSHFDLYLAAMEDVGAETSAVRDVVGRLGRLGRGDGPTVSPAGSPAVLAAECGAPRGAVEFISTTFRTVTEGSTLEVASAFALGREQLIPDMFGHLVDADRGRLLVAYLRRHVELDEGEHGPLARRLVEHLAGGEQAAWQTVEDAAASAVKARLRLWDAVVSEIEFARIAL